MANTSHAVEFEESPPPTILVVDDDHNTREALKALLELEGYQVATAADGEQGLVRLYETPIPALILLDLSMPSMDGYEFRERQLHAARHLSSIPVVVCSAHFEKEDNGHRLAASAYLTKPVDIARLRSVVAHLCPVSQPTSH